MKRHILVFGGCLLALMFVVLYPRFEPARAQDSGPYVPSGIPVSDLGEHTPPGRLNVRFPLRDPAQVGESIRQQLLQPQRAAPFSAEAVPTITAEIQTLAAGLENNPLAIYDYVHNHIGYVPSYGLLKNPRETLLAEAGNAYDQAALLSALLNAAGFQTRYVWGTIEISKTAAMNWVGAADPSAVGYVFANGGIPTADAGSALQLSHIWVEVLDQSVWHPLDPAFKSYRELAGQDLRAGMGYSLTTFLVDAQSGATITLDYTQNLNQANIRGDLANYALNLVNYLRSSKTFASLDAMIGGRHISPATSAAYPAALPYTVVQTSGTANNIPNSLAYTLNIQLPGVNYTTRINDIAGERITVFYECATAVDCQLLNAGGGIYNVYPAYLVDVVPKLRIGGAVVATGTAVSLGTWDQLLHVSITAPFDDPASSTFSSDQYLVAGEWYALPMRLQTVSNEALARHARLLDDAMAAQGLADDDERRLGESLNVLGLAYFNEVEAGDRVDARLAQVVKVPHFSLAIVSRNLSIWVDVLQRPVMLDPASHSVDVRLSLDAVVSAQNPANSNRERAWMLSAGMRGSAAEHAILEQLQPVTAVSTIQALNFAAASGQRTYYVTPANQGTVLPLLNNHDPSVIASLQADLAGGRDIIISQSPVTYGQWTGSAWITLDPDSGSAGYMIAGGLGSIKSRRPPIVSGGGGTRSQPPGDDALVALLARTGRQPHSEDNDNTETNTPDPIDTATGSFLYHHEDIASLNGLGIPLSLERYYASSRGSLTGTLGFGWSHTYDTRFYTSTDWLRGFGERLALEAAPALAGAQVGIDLFDAAAIPQQRHTLDIVAAQWLMTKITGNAATYVEPDGTLAAHLRLSDGTFQPPSGAPYLNSVTFAGDGSATLNWRDGTRAQFNAAGRPAALEDAAGNRTTLSYNGQGRLSQAADAAGRSLVFTYTAQGLLAQVGDPLGRTFKYSYDASGDLKTYTDPRGGVITYTYAANHRLLNVTDQLSTTYVANQYDTLGRAQRQTDGRGGQTSLLFGGDHTVVVDPLGYRTTYFFDDRARLLGRQNALGNRISIGYDAADHEITRTNGLSLTTAQAYDTRGNRVTITDSLGYTSTWAYNPAGFPIRYTDQRGKRWQYGYDGLNNLTTITNPLGGVTRYTYNARGQVIQSQDPAGVAATYRYDSYGNLACLTNGLGEANCRRYDLAGRPISFTNGLNQATLLSYDAANNLRQVTDPLGRQTRYGYNAVSSVISFTTPNNATTRFRYDTQFNLIGVTDAAGKSVTYTYDLNNALIGLTDANGHATRYQRDKAGRLITLTDSLSRSVAFGYDAADRLTSFRRADGSLSTYQRDALGRLAGIDYPLGADIHYRYDPAGNLISATYGSNWSALYRYDDAGRLAAINDSRNLTTTYTTDPGGRRTNLRVTRGAAVLYDLAYAYNAAARLSALTDNTSGQAAAIAYSYDGAGRLARITDPGGARADYAYDAAGHITGVNHRDNQNRLIAAYTYAYDADGNATSAGEAMPYGAFTTSYAYDALNRLTSETAPRYSINYAYDAAGNLTQRADPLGVVNYTYDAAGQLQSRGSETFGYDLNGNLTTWQNSRGVYNYSYDYGNLLTGLTVPGVPGGTFNLTYDAFGRRLAIQGLAETRGFLDDGLSAVLEGSADLGQVTARYLYGNDWLASRYTDQLGYTAFHGDALENVRYLTDNNGQPLDAYRYDAYGRPAQPAGIDPNPFRFVGQRNVYQSAAPVWPILTGWRAYDAASGRFLTRDPLNGDLRQPQSLNDYAYGLDNPLRYSDPTGLRAPEDFPVEDEQNAEPSANETSTAIETIGSDQLQNPLAAVRRQQRSVPPDRPERLQDQILNLPAGEPRDIAKPGPAALEDGSTRWQPVAYLGGMFALTCPANDRLLAGAFQSGLYRSADAQHTHWDNRFAASVGDFAVANANTYYAGAWYEGALKSSDGGATWVPITSGLAANDVYALAISPTLSSRIYAGTELGLFVSSNAGASWGRPSGNLPGRLVSELAFAGNTLLAVTDLGLYRSSDGGASWQPPATDLPPVRINTLLAGSPSTTVYAGTSLGLYRSTDSGNTWAPVGTLANRDVHALAIDPANANRMLAGSTTGLYVSVDGGNTWNADTNAGLNGTAALIGAIAFCPGGGDANLYLGTGNGVYALRTPVPPEAVVIDGPAKGWTQTGYNFTAAVSPVSVTLPITYTWRATGQAAVTRTGGLSDTAAWVWSYGATGTKFITVTIDNGLGIRTDSHVITLANLPQAPTALSITGPVTGAINTRYLFTASVSPITTALPITYVWDATGQTRVTNANVNALTYTVAFTWPSGAAGAKTITVTVRNSAGMLSATSRISILYRVYLPVVRRQ
jgi:RHS repeat-associated protein